MFAKVGSHLVEAEEILLPSLEAKVCDRHDDLAAHHLSLQMGVAYE